MSRSQVAPNPRARVKHAKSSDAWDVLSLVSFRNKISDEELNFIQRRGANDAAHAVVDPQRFFLGFWEYFVDGSANIKNFVVGFGQDILTFTKGKLPTVINATLQWLDEGSQFDNMSNESETTKNDKLNAWLSLAGKSEEEKSGIEYVVSLLNLKKRWASNVSLVSHQEVSIEGRLSYACLFIKELSKRLDTMVTEVKGLEKVRPQESSRPAARTAAAGAESRESEEQQSSQINSGNPGTSPRGASIRQRHQTTQHHS